MKVYARQMIVSFPAGVGFSVSGIGFIGFFLIGNAADDDTAVSDLRHTEFFLLSGGCFFGSALLTEGDEL